MDSGPPPFNGDLDASLAHPPESTWHSLRRPSFGASASPAPTFGLHLMWHAELGLTRSPVRAPPRANCHVSACTCCNPPKRPLQASPRDQSETQLLSLEDSSRTLSAICQRSREEGRGRDRGLRGLLSRPPPLRRDGSDQCASLRGNCSY